MKQRERLERQEYCGCSDFEIMFVEIKHSDCKQQTLHQLFILQQQPTGSYHNIKKYIICSCLQS